MPTTAEPRGPFGSADWFEPLPVRESAILEIVDYMNSLPREDRGFEACTFYCMREIKKMSVRRRISLHLRMQALATIIERGVLRSYVPRIDKTNADGFSVPEDVLRAAAAAPLALTLNEYQQERWHFEPEAFLSHLLTIIKPTITA